MKISALLIAYILLTQTTVALSQYSDSIDLRVINSPDGVPVRPVSISEGYFGDYTVYNKKFLLGYYTFMHTLFRRDILLKKFYDPVKNNISYDSSLHIMACVFDREPTREGQEDSRFAQPDSLSYLYFTNNKVNTYFSLNVTGYRQKEYGEVIVGGNSFNSLDMHCGKVKLSLLSNTSDHNITLFNGDFSSITCRDNIIKDSSSGLLVRESKVANFDYSCSLPEKLYIYFLNDTLTGDFSLKDEATKSIDPATGKKPTRIVFNSCYINADLQIVQSLPGIKVFFVNCKFGPLASLNRLAVDTIDFDQCYNFENTVMLGNQGQRTCYLSFKNTDVDKLIFDYYYWFKLYTPEWTENYPDKINSMYGTLLAKFKKEEKRYSAEAIDIEYKKYKYEHNWYGGGIMNFVDKAWWYYGYKRERPIYWSFLFVFIFFGINLASWKYISTVYKIVPPVADGWYQRQKKWKQYDVKTIIQIFIFSVLVFFSLYIDFDKLSFKSTRWLLWFFFQYLVGLFCLFFIINAILKF